MSAPQPPEDRVPDRTSGTSSPSDSDATAGSAGGTYEFHGEKLDFDPYRFGAPESPPPAWEPTAPRGAGTGPGRPPEPGERWDPDADPERPDVHPGDYWQGGAPGPRPGDVFPPAGYAPPPAGSEAGRGRVDLDKAPSGYPPPSAYPPPGYPGYPPPGRTAHGGYPAPPRPVNPRTGNGLAVSGMVVGIVGIVLALTSWPGIVVGIVGLVLSVVGLVRARRGAPMKGIAIAGVICSIVAIVASSIVLVVVLSRIDFDCVRDAGGSFDQAQECVK